MFNYSAGLDHQVAVQPLLASLLPFVSERVVEVMCPCFRWVHVALEWPTYLPLLSQLGLTVDQWDGHGRLSVPLGAAGAAGVLWRQRRVMAAFASARALARHLFAVTSFLTVSFFWIAAFARLSSDVTMRAACLASVAAWYANARLPAVIWLMSRDSAKAAVQCVFQLFHVWLMMGQRFHLRHANSIPPQVIAALVLVNTMVASEMGMPASRAKVWHFSCLHM